MLKNTFCHIQGITLQTENALWQDGVMSWDDFFKRKNDLLISKLPSSKKEIISQGLLKSLKAVEKKDYSMFKSLPRNQYWRVYDYLRDDACFLDIETTGLSKHNHEITLIGIYGRYGTKIFMNGENLEDFKGELEKYSVVVTFNGSCFDLPFLMHKFPDLVFDHFHLDLRYLLANLGFKGGLKKIEVDLGISRDDELEGVTGYDAVILWFKYKKGDVDALDKLKKYLRADIENLKLLMDFAYEGMEKKHLSGFDNKSDYKNVIFSLGSDGC